METIGTNLNKGMWGIVREAIKQGALVGKTQQQVIYELCQNGTLPCISNEEAKTRDERDEQQRKQQTLSERLAYVPERYKQTKWNAKSFANKAINGQNVYIYGSYGVGKTQLLWDIYQDLCKRDMRVRAIDGVEVVRDIASDYDAASRAIKKRVLNIPILLIDDIDKSCSTDRDVRSLYEIVNKRNSHQRPTVCTSNIPLNDLSKALGGRSGAEAIQSRISENCELVHLTGDDRRTEIMNA